MTQNANILSFNEVKARGASAPRTVSQRSSHARHAAHFEPRSGRSAFSQTSSSAGYFDRSGHQGLGHSSYQGSGRFSSEGSYYVQSGSSGSISGNYGFIQDQKSGGFSSRGLDRSRFQNSGGSTNFGSAGNAGRFSSAGHTTRADNSFRRNSSSRTDQSVHRDQSPHTEQPSRHGTASHAEHHEEGFFRGLQKRFRSAKAERDFDRTIGARERKAQEDAQRAQSSRAAVYEMHMGATHRKSARMQNHDGKKSGFGGFGFSLPFNLSAGALSAAAARGIVALAVVVFAVFMLYPSCQNYYVETRQLQQLQAEYDALNSYNTQMQSQIDYLNTDEGLEEYARSELGWIRQDEHMATVEGVESSVEGSTQSSTTHSPLNEDIPAPDTWYSGVLDVFFGYGK